jgi:prolyl oligopeptidase
LVAAGGLDVVATGYFRNGRRVSKPGQRLLLMHFSKMGVMKILAAALLSTDLSLAAPPAPIPIPMTNPQPTLNYPSARTVEQADDYFGTRVPDPYRWMEDVDSPEVKAWVDQENALTRSYLDQVPAREVIRDRILHLNRFERYSLPVKRGTRYFYSHNQGLQNQNVMFWQEGLHGAPHLLLDPNTLSSDGTVALNGFEVTDDGRLAAYAISDAGSDWLTWYVRDVATGKDLPDVIRW